MTSGVAARIALAGSPVARGRLRGWLVAWLLAVCATALVLAAPQISSPGAVEGIGGDVASVSQTADHHQDRSAKGTSKGGEEVPSPGTGQPADLEESRNEIDAKLLAAFDAPSGLSQPRIGDLDSEPRPAIVEATPNGDLPPQLLQRPPPAG